MTEDGRGWTSVNGTGEGEFLEANDAGERYYYKLLRFSNHAHSFNYAVDGTSITAICIGAGECLEAYKTNGFTLTLEGPEDLTYDGKAKEATITGYPESTVKYLAAKPEVVYYKSTGPGSTTPSGSKLNSAPTDAGNYVAQMTWGEKTAGLAFSIAQATPDVVAPSGLTAAYGQTLADVTLPTATDGTWTWQDAATTSVGDAGSNTFKATFTPTDTKNYATITDVDVTITVQEKKTYSFTSGAGGKWTSGSTDTLEFVVKANRDDEATIDHFTGIQVDGQDVENGYTKKSGSVVIDLQPDYLKTLSAGEHKLAVSFDDADAIDTTFTIEAAQEETKPADTSPKTGDSNRMVIWVILMAAALAGGISILIVALKRRQQ